MKLSDLKSCGNRLNTNQDLNNKTVAIWGPDVGIGDWANATAGFRELKKIYAKLMIIIVCGNKIPKDFLLSCPYIDLVLYENDIQNINDILLIDYGINFQIDDNTLWHKLDGSDTTTIERQFTELGLTPPNYISSSFTIPYTSYNHASCLAKVLELKSGNFIVHHCGATNPALRWPHNHVKKFSSLIYEKFGFPTVIVGYEEEWNEEKVNFIINLTENYSISTIMALMELSGWFVGGHSSFNCIGSGLAIKMISLFPYYKHYYRWSGFYLNSYNLVRSYPLDGNHLAEHFPEKVFSIFEKLFNDNITLPVTELF